MIVWACISVLLLSFIFSMLGLGGAMLYVPLFHWLGFDFKTEAIPTALLLNGITVLSASIVYFRSKMVDIKGAIPLVITSFIGASGRLYYPICTNTHPYLIICHLYGICGRKDAYKLWPKG